MTTPSSAVTVSARPSRRGRLRPPERGSPARFGAGSLAMVAVLIAAVQAGPGVRAEAPDGRKESVDRWIAALKGPDAKARAEAARSLGALGPEARAAAPALVGALGDADAAVRLRAAAALARVGGSLRDALPVLLAARNDPDEGIRREAEAAWGGIGPGVRATMPYAGQLLRTNDMQAQGRAVAAFA